MIKLSHMNHINNDKRIHLQLEEEHILGGNVACLNGWAYTIRTNEVNEVTCSKCLEKIKEGYHLQRDKRG